MKTKVLPILSKKKNKKTLRKAQGKATILALTGDLGAGKTALTRSLLRNLGVKGRVTSPTFTLIRHYRLPRGNSRGLSKTAPFTDAYHMDCYRLRKPEELLMLGFEEIINNPNNVVIIEWPELMESYLPKQSTMRFSLEHGKTKNERVIHFR